MKIYISFIIFCLVVGLISFLPGSALAHRSGCHNLHSCPSDSNTYVCGDLGYPCDGSTSIKNVNITKINVPLLVETTFRDVFGRVPTEAESAYWKKRFRGDKESIYQMRRVMAWHKVNGSGGLPVPSVGNAPTTPLGKRINALFRAVHDGRNPTVSENRYWLSRIKDKPTEVALKNAMAFHKANNIQH